jgi:transposase-like protein
MRADAKPNTGLPNLERRRRVARYLRLGLPPMDIARMEGISHQRVYALMKQMRIVKKITYKETP